MPGIMPDVSNGGIVIRTLAGVCTNLSEAPNAYCPPPSFVTTCQVTALAEDCASRVMPSQINAIVSELMCLAVTLDPNGPWNCNSNCNLSTMFQTWASQFGANTTVETDGTTVEGDGTAANPIAVIPAGVVAAICGDSATKQALASCLVSSDANNTIVIGSDGGLYDPPIVVGNGLTGDGTTANPITVDIPSLVSADAGNILDVGADGKLSATIAVGSGIAGDGTDAFPLTASVDIADVVAGICGDFGQRQNLAGCLISTSANNQIVQGGDGGLFVGPATVTGVEGDGVTISAETPFSIMPDGVVAAICSNPITRGALVDCVLSDDPNNELIVDPVNGGIFYQFGGASAVSVVSAICGTPVAREGLATCLISTDPDNGIELGTDGGLFSAASPVQGDGVTITASSPFSVVPAGIADAFCDDEDARTALTECLVSSGVNNILVLDSEGKFYVPASAAGAVVGDGVTITEDSPFSVLPEGVVGSICGDAEARAALATCMRVVSQSNLIEAFPTGLYYGGPITDFQTIDGNGSADDPLTILPDGVVAAICGDASARNSLMTCIRSADADNAIVLGSDGRLFVAPSGGDATLPLYNQANAYEQGDMVVTPWGIAVAQQNIPAGSPFEDNVGEWLPKYGQRPPLAITAGTTLIYNRDWRMRFLALTSPGAKFLNLSAVVSEGASNGMKPGDWFEGYSFGGATTIYSPVALRSSGTVTANGGGFQVVTTNKDGAYFKVVRISDTEYYVTGTLV